MQCKNCGAPLKPYDNNDYFFCPYCGSFQFPVETLDGVKVMGNEDSELCCPVCGSQLSTASIDKVPVLHCQKCRGILTDRHTFFLIVKARRRRTEARDERVPALERRALQRNITCPQCGKPMETFPYSGPGNIIIDTCSRCDLIWLDYGEFHRAVMAPGHHW